eukprot:CAMPEP_0116826486 /NCGR_PEP_ID=MMETSP0418-20121206/2554_1 /TAXON_ID=1158023 /ORGANISM="Astrosyne radiata, Strain 13vi08-1A" /LENGTH=104 /DNA_ID=CAMNT_0004455123 /DNA_START=641 /DNA_END=953 /DNA_ORIENTATION=-
MIIVATMICSLPLSNGLSQSKWFDHKEKLKKSCTTKIDAGSQQLCTEKRVDLRIEVPQKRAPIFPVFFHEQLLTHKANKKSSSTMINSHSGKEFSTQNDTSDPV